MNEDTTSAIKCLFWFMMVALFIICLPKIIAAIGAAIVYLFQAIAVMIIGYIALAVVYAILSIIFNVKFEGDVGNDEQTYRFA